MCNCCRQRSQTLINFFVICNFSTSNYNDLGYVKCQHCITMHWVHNNQVRSTDWIHSNVDWMSCSFVLADTGGCCLSLPLAVISLLLFCILHHQIHSSSCHLSTVNTLCDSNNHPLETHCSVYWLNDSDSLCWWSWVIELLKFLEELFQP